MIKPDASGVDFTLRSNANCLSLCIQLISKAIQRILIERAIREAGLHNILKNFSISIALVRNQSGSLVYNKKNTVILNPNISMLAAAQSIQALHIHPIKFTALNIRTVGHMKSIKRFRCYYEIFSNSTPLLRLGIVIFDNWKITSGRFDSIESRILQNRSRDSRKLQHFH
jgi:hypothetical protein